MTGGEYITSSSELIIAIIAFFLYTFFPYLVSFFVPNVTKWNRDRIKYYRSIKTESFKYDKNNPETRRNVFAYYMLRSKMIRLSPPSWIFFPVWTLLYSLLTVAIILIWWERTEDDNFWLTIVILYLVQILLTHLWQPLFFEYRWEKMACFLLSMTTIISIVMTVFSWINEFWVSSSFFTLYCLWLLYAFYLNFMHVILDKRISGNLKFSKRNEPSKSFGGRKGYQEKPGKKKKRYSNKKNNKFFKDKYSIV